MSEDPGLLKPRSLSAIPSLDERILAALERLSVSNIEELCRDLFPERDWVACQMSRSWPEYGGALASTAWLVHWRCSVLARRQVIRQVSQLDTDRFAGPSPVVPPSLRRADEA